MTAIVGWAPILAPWPDCTLRAVEPLIPPPHFVAAMRYRRWQDRQARLSARLLLRRILRTQGVPASLDDIALTPEDRPFIRGGGDFSIAHTTTLALCAWVPHGRIGIDVEAPRPGLTLDDMDPWMSDAERRRIAASAAPMDEALLFWTAKEAVCKADGCGIAAGALPDCATSRVAFRSKIWRVRSRRWRDHTISLALAAEAPFVRRTFRLGVDHEVGADSARGP